MAAELGNKARNHRLTIYAGAGLSAAPPTSLPGAAQLAKRLADAFEEYTGLALEDPWDLLAVADAVAAQPRGAGLLRDTVLRVADLLSAPVSYGHRVLALLVCEGAATVLETNYDDCIERAAQPERLPVVRTAIELLHGQNAALLKAHGCATLPTTMLITTADLEGVALWADATISAKLSSDHVLFVGIGSVADYVRKSIDGVLAATGHDHITLVDPALRGWEDSPPVGWRQLLPALPEDQRIPEDASAFCDALLRAYLAPFRQELRHLVSGFATDHGQFLGTKVLLGELESHDGVLVLRWLRDMSWGLSPGASALTQVTTSVLIAVGALLCGGWSPRMANNGLLFASSDNKPPNDRATHEVPVLLVAVQGTKSGASAAQEARRRLIEARNQQLVDPSADTVVVIGGHIGNLGLEEVTVSRGCSLQHLRNAATAMLGQTPTDLIADSHDDHLIDGPRGGRIFLVDAAAIGEVREAS